MTEQLSAAKEEKFVRRSSRIPKPVAKFSACSESEESDDEEPKDDEGQDETWRKRSKIARKSPIKKKARLSRDRLTSTRALSVHRANHCSFCDAVFDSRKARSAHENAQHLTCEFCERTFITVANVLGHHCPRKIALEMKRKAERNEENKRKEQRSGEDDLDASIEVVAPFPCGVCGMRCRNLTILQSHIALMHRQGQPPGNLFHCRFCLRDFASKSAKTMHEMILHFACHLCSAHCVNRTSLALHMDTLHPAQMSVVIQPVDTRPRTFQAATTVWDTADFGAYKRAELVGPSTAASSSGGSSGHPVSTVHRPKFVFAYNGVTRSPASIAAFRPLAGSRTPLILRAPGPSIRPPSSAYGGLYAPSFSCERCKCTFDNQSSLTKHTALANCSLPAHSCDRCECSFFNARTLIKHQAVGSCRPPHHKDHLYRYANGAKEQTVATIPRVVRVSSGAVSYPCSVCGKRYCFENKRNLHERDAHGLPLPGPQHYAHADEESNVLSQEACGREEIESGSEKEKQTINADNQHQAAMFDSALAMHIKVEPPDTDYEDANVEDLVCASCGELFPDLSAKEEHNNQGKCRTNFEPATEWLDGVDGFPVKSDESLANESSDPAASIVAAQLQAQPGPSGSACTTCGELFVNAAALEAHHNAVPDCRLGIPRTPIPTEVLANADIRCFVCGCRPDNSSSTSFYRLPSSCDPRRKHWLDFLGFAENEVWRHRKRFIKEVIFCVRHVSESPREIQIGILPELVDWNDFLEKPAVQAKPDGSTKAKPDVPTKEGRHILRIGERENSGRHSPSKDWKNVGESIKMNPHAVRRFEETLDDVAHLASSSVGADSLIDHVPSAVNRERVMAHLAARKSAAYACPFCNATFSCTANKIAHVLVNHKQQAQVDSLQMESLPPRLPLTPPPRVNKAKKSMPKSTEIKRKMAGTGTASGRGTGTPILSLQIQVTQRASKCNEPPRS